MTGRRLALGVFLLLSADFGNPYIGGAFTFESSIEVLDRQRGREAQSARVLALPPGPPLPLVPVANTRVEHRVPPRATTQPGWSPGRPRAYAFAETSSASTEEH